MTYYVFQNKAVSGWPDGFCGASSTCFSPLPCSLTTPYHPGRLLTECSQCVPSLAPGPMQPPSTCFRSHIKCHLLRETSPSHPKVVSLSHGYTVRHTCWHCFQLRIFFFNKTYDPLEWPVCLCGEGNRNLLQCSCLGNSLDRGAWRGLLSMRSQGSDTTQRLNHHLHLVFVNSVSSLTRLQFQDQQLARMPGFGSRGGGSLESLSPSKGDGNDRWFMGEDGSFDMRQLSLQQGFK